MNVIDFARQIINMEWRIEELEIENEKLKGYEKMYNELLDSSISHNHVMMGHLLNACLDVAVVRSEMGTGNES